MFLKRFPLHFLLLLLFFLLHGYSENIGLIPFKDLLIFFLVGALTGFLFFLLFKKITRSPIKAGIITTIAFLFYLFYGSIKDALKGGAFNLLSRYSILLPLMLVIIVALCIYFRRTKKDFPRLNFFINCVLLVYLVVDVATIAVRGPGSPVVPATARQSYTKCDTCTRPDIYLIVMDEYSGSRMLRDFFHYNNEPFETALRQKGFFVAAKPSSNYSATPVSIASLFAMDYMPAFHRKLVAEDYTRSENIVNQSATMQLLNDHGYRFMNHSIFNLGGQPGQFKTDLLPMRLRLITAKTMWNSINTDLGWQIHIKLAPRIKWLAFLLQDDYKDGNQRLLRLTNNATSVKDTQPRFIYTHVLMPHWPYLLDSMGKETGINFYSPGITGIQRQTTYVQYLAYTNKVMLKMVDTIMHNSNQQAAIILMSDHGYRDRPEQICRDVNDNFTSVYLPGKNYQQFYDSISNVNLFRAFLNTTFNQRFARLPDQCIF
ncbi:MAG: sulfatase-like hydrolase/transferase [Chitinophagaceae bacterium]